MQPINARGKALRLHIVRKIAHVALVASSGCARIGVESVEDAATEDGSRTDVAIPLPDSRRDVDPAETIVADADPPRRWTVSAGTDGLHTCAVSPEGKGWCWGSNSIGQLGDGTKTDRSTPTALAGVASISRLVAGGAHTCAIAGAGNVFCWGHNSSGQIGDGTTIDRLVPTPVSGLTGVWDIALGDFGTCALHTDGTISCWGYDGWRMLGFDTGLDCITGRCAKNPRKVPDLANVVQIALSYSHTCALLASGKLLCWGSNDQGQLGDGTTVDREAPTPVAASTLFSSVAVGRDATCAVGVDGRAYCWGSDIAARLGYATSEKCPVSYCSTKPAPVVGLSKVASVALGERHTCARTSGGEVACWGANEFGQLGDGSTVRGVIPAYPSTGVAKGLTLGAVHTCIARDDALSCWGANAQGQVGDGTTTNAFLPTLVKF